MKADRIIRHHTEPRTKCYMPTKKDCPLSLGLLSGTRFTTVAWCEGGPGFMQSHQVTDPVQAEHEFGKTWTGKSEFILKSDWRGSHAAENARLKAGRREIRQPAQGAMKSALGAGRPPSPPRS